MKGNKKLPTTYSLLPTGKRSGFTLLELVIFTAIFSLVIIAFISVLISITRTQVRQTAVTEVNQQSQFLLQAAQYYVQRSSLIDGNPDVATTSITLRMPAGTGAASEDPTLLFASGTQIFSKVGANSAQALTSTRVVVSNFTMTKHSNPGGRDNLSLSFTVSYNTVNPQQNFIQSLSYAVARVNAATFDSGIYPVAQSNVNNKLGVTSGDWASIDGILYFSGYNAGIGAGVTSGGSAFQVRGSDIYVDNPGSGIILKSAGGSCYRVYVTNGGLATTTGVAVTCQ